MRYFPTFILLIAFLLSSTAICPAQNASGDWNSLGNHLNREIAVKTKSGPVVYGILRRFDDAEIKVQTADKKSISNVQTVFRRETVEKIWSAQLRFGGRRAGTGALVGATVGAGLGLATAVTEKEDGQAGAAVPIFAIYGAAVGGLIGFFAKKSHQRGELIYGS